MEFKIELIEFEARNTVSNPVTDTWIPLTKGQ